LSPPSSTGFLLPALDKPAADFSFVFPSELFCLMIWQASYSVVRGRTKEVFPTNVLLRAGVPFFFPLLMNLLWASFLSPRAPGSAHSPPAQSQVSFPGVQTFYFFFSSPVPLWHVRDSPVVSFELAFILDVDRILRFAPAGEGPVPWPIQWDFSLRVYVPPSASWPKAPYRRVPFCS